MQVNNNRKEELAFNEARQELLASKEKINKAISAYNDANEVGKDELGMSEADYIRLTRVLQLAEKFLPKRLVHSADQNIRTRRQLAFEKILEGYRNLKGIKLFKKPKVEETEIFTNSYTMSEALVKNLHKLRQYDFLLKNLSGESTKVLESMLNNKPNGRISRERSEGPGILDDYRQSNWGVTRICLDGIQNHLPTDAKGTTCWLHFEIDGKWVSVEEARLSPRKITRVRFADDGVGFTPDNLLYLHSTKSSEAQSVGQFGEGMKLASMASINLGLGLEIQSRNWTAFAVGEDKQLINTRDNDRIENRKKLVYNITEYEGGENLVGSRTIFHSPSQGFIDFALTLPSYVLELQPNYKHLFSTNLGDIVDSSVGGQVFVKGIFIEQLNSLFSYNFDLAGVNPDRNQLSNFSVDNAVNIIVQNITDIRVMKTLIAKMIEYYRNNSKQYSWDWPFELKAGESLFNQFKRGNGVPSLWCEAFKQVLEQKDATNEEGKPIEAILKTDYEIPEQLRDNLTKYNVVSLPHYWTAALQMAGVKTDRESLPEFISDIIPTSISLEYGAGIWNNERMVLDAIQNHLPSDSGGRYVFLRFQTSDGIWHDFSKFSQFNDAEIKKIKISDDGNGYDLKSLGLFASAKNHNVSSGKWGEGLKMLSAVALRNGLKMELRSRDWMAVPKAQSLILNQGESNEKKVQQLVFETMTKVGVDSKLLDDKDNPSNIDNEYHKSLEKSSTTFIDPNPSLIKEFRVVKEKVLALSRKYAIATVGGSEVLDLSSGKLFVRGIQIPGNHNIKYGYHLSNFDIETRDRNAITSESLQIQLRHILENIDNERFISAFLKDAVEYATGSSSKQYWEFTTIFNVPDSTYQADSWIRVFKQDFGDKTSIRGRSNQDMNAVHQAQHLGVDMITLPDNVANALIGLKGKDGQTIASYEEELENSLSNIIPVPDEDLTDYERYMIAHLLKYNQMLAQGGHDYPITTIKIFDYDEKYDGAKADGFASLGDIININRVVLNGDLQTLGHVFFHESGHAVTGEKDADKIFRDFLSNLLSSVAMENIPINIAELHNMNSIGIDEATEEVSSTPKF